MNDLFDDYQQMIAECDQLLREDEDDAHDRAAISSFYNGRSTMSPEEQERTGTENITNHLFGYDSLNMARGQIESIHTRPMKTWEIELYDVPAHLKQKWEMSITNAFNTCIKDSRRFKPEWKGLSGDITLFGRGTLIFRDAIDWCPSLATPYVPRNTGILPNQIPYFSLADQLDIIDLKRGLRSAEERIKLGMDPGWNVPLLRDFIKMLEGQLKDGITTGPIVASNQTIDEKNEEAMSNSSFGLRNKVPVYYLYSGTFGTEKDGSFDIVILPRFTTAQSDTLSKASNSDQTWLYHGKNIFERPEHVIHPMFIDCALGGKMNWHRVMGLGRLNYDPDVEIEEFFNDAMAGSREQIRRVYQVQSAGDWEILKAWADSKSPTNVLPPGVQVADLGRQPGFQHAFQTIQMLMELTKRNASGSIPHAESGKVKELEVQAVERQGRNAETMASRMSDIYECTDALGSEMFRRFLLEEPLECDAGYQEISRFQKMIREDGVPIATLRKMDDGRFRHVCVKTSRSVGDGNAVRRRMTNQMLMARLHLFNPEAQQIILRRVTAEESGDYQFAESVVPYEKKDDPNQIERAEVENRTMDRQGILGVPMPTNPDDLDMVHVQRHMRDMQADLQRAKIRPWDMVDLAAFKAKGSHAYAHIQRLLQIKEQKQMAQKIIQELQSLAKAGQEHANNLQKQQQAAQEPLSKKDQEDLRLKEEKQRLAERTQDALEQHRAASLNLATQKAKVTAASTAINTAINEENANHSRMIAERSLEEQITSSEADRQMAQADQGEEEDPFAGGEQAPPGFLE